MIDFLPNRAFFFTGSLSISAWAAAILIAGAQLMPDAPVSNFRLPMFGEDGFPEWDLRGEEARYVDEKQVDLNGMKLSVYDDLQPGRVETVIVSPSAVFLIEENRLVGNDSIRVDGDNFQVLGDIWRWIGDEKSVEIDGNVKVTFFEELTGILQ